MWYIRALVFHEEDFNPLLAKFFQREHKYTFTFFVSFLHIDTRQVVEIHSQTRTTRTPAFWGYLPPPHDYPYHWVILDPKSKEDKVKVTNLTRQIWGIWKLRPAYSPKRPIWVKIGDVLSRVTLKFDGWPWKTIGHLFFAVSSFVQHFIAIVEFKLELQSGNAQFESNSTISRAMWPWNLMDDLEKQ